MRGNKDHKDNKNGLKGNSVDKREEVTIEEEEFAAEQAE
jgi:hypothetical protein